MSDLSQVKLLAVCDSPTLTTGFSRVATNLLSRFPLQPEQIHVWGIGFDGAGYKDCPWQVFPAGHPWHGARALSSLLQAIYVGKYTHVWMLQDLFQLSQAGFPEGLRQATQAGFTHNGERGRTRTTLYFPVDHHWMPAEWVDILGVVDAAVAYTEFGRKVTLDAVARRSKPEAKKQKHPPLKDPHWADIAVLPHGVDTKIYHPLAIDRDELRQGLWLFDGKPWVQPGDFLLLNVNTNQRRKDVTRSMEILAELVERGVPAKLVMHMAEQDDQGVSLEKIGEQLGLEYGKHWLHHGEFFERAACRSTMPESELVKLYHAADLLLTTTLGEGWGLSITEALACGCPVALPEHTACWEICRRLEGFGQEGLTLLVASDRAPVLGFDNGVIRRRVELKYAASQVSDCRLSWVHGDRNRPRLLERSKQWLDWDRIAAEMWKVVLG